MGAATRASTAKAVEALAAVKGSPADLGEQLLSVARAVASSHQLTAVLADPGVPAEQRVALADKAVGTGLTAAAKPVLAALVSGRWSTPDDLVGAIEEIGFRALAGSADAARLGTQLFTVQRAVSSDGALELALGNQASPIAARLGLVDGLLKDADPATVAILRHVVALPRGRKPVEALNRAQDVIAEARGGLVAVVQTARPLTESQASSLASRLTSAYGRKIALNQVVEPDLVAGVRITVGDDVIDGTVRARLDDLRLRLAG